MARIIAIDFGAKRTGIAATDPERIIASPLGYKQSDELMDFLKEYFSKEEVDEIVLGYPTNHDGEDTDATPLVRKFKDSLQKNFPDKKIILHDESFTSKIAQEAIRDGGLKKKKRREKGMIDSIAATLILQSYMESI